MWPCAKQLYTCSGSDEPSVAGNWTVVTHVITETSGAMICEWDTNPLVRISHYKWINFSSNICTE